MDFELRQHPYADFVHRVQKPSRYLGGEHGEVRKDWSTLDATMCLAFPDVYDIGMSHLGFKILYSLLNDDPELCAERAYAPWTDMESELRARGEPLRSLETWRPLCEFDVVGFSLQFELTYTNVLLMLELGGIPRRAAARGESDPLVLAGGPTATHAEPLAPFIDAFVIGDGEEITPRILRDWTAAKKAGVPREERLRRLATLTGVYVPALYAVEREPATGALVVTRSLAPEAPLPVQRAFVDNLDRYPFPSGGPVASTETIFDRVSVEIARGCTEGCRFCQAGMIYRPVRERDPVAIAETIERAVKDGGYDEASLTCLSTADYSAVSPLIKEVTRRLDRENVSLSVSSLRAYGLSEDLLDDIKKVRAGGLTFAPEAGTQRMRDVVNKNVTEEQLMETAERVFSRGWSKMKLYFMIGLPTEEDVDVRGIVETGACALAVGRRVQKGSPRVTVSVSTHVPKPHTPFQWCAMDSLDEIRRKQSMLRDAVRATKLSLRLHDSAGSWLEGILSRGDRSLADVIERAYDLGARFDSWEERLKLDAWEAAFRDSGVDGSIFLGTIPVTARLPWDHIDVGLADGFLAREYKKAVRNRLSPPCGKAVGMFVHHTNGPDARADKRRLVCYDCGVACDMTEMRDKRIEFLDDLDRVAVDRAEARALALADPEVAIAPDVAPPGPRVRVRFGYTKLGRAAFSSHLDMVRLLPRLARRLELPVHYTQGFHPKPEMTFGPALSLGIASLSEFVDVRLRSDAHIDVDQLAERLTRVGMDGIHFFGARLLAHTDASLNKVIDRAVYVAAIARSSLGALGLGDERDIEQRVRERVADPAVDLRVRRVIEGVGKIVDVRKYLVSVRVGEGDDVLARSGLVGSVMPITIELAITPNGTAKAAEALDALLGIKDVPARIVRAALVAVRGDETLSPLDLDELRIAAAAAAAAAAADREASASAAAAP